MGDCEKEWQEVENLKKRIANTEAEIARNEKALDPLKADLDKASKELASKRTAEKDLDKDIRETNHEFRKPASFSKPKPSWNW